MDTPTPRTQPPGAPAPAPDDAEVARRVRAGEVDLFELLMRRHNQRVYRAVRGLLSDEAEVEDVMQQAYVSAYVHLAQFTGAARFSTWLVRIAVNEALMHLRRTRRLVALDGGLEAQVEEDVMGTHRSSTPSPEELTSQRELLGLMERSLDDLPELYRVVFVLRDVEGLSTAECAEALDVSEDVVKTRLHRAKALLRERLATAMEGHASEVFAFHAPRCDRVVARVMAALRAR